MFRIKSKKAAVQRRITTSSSKRDEDDDDDDNDEGPSDMAVMIRSAQLKAKSKNGLRNNKKNANTHVSSSSGSVTTIKQVASTSTTTTSRPIDGPAVGAVAAVIPPSLGTLQEEEEQDEQDTMKSTSKKKIKHKRKRMGYGGHLPGEEDVDAEQTELNNNDSSTGYRYDSETLSKLKSEQPKLDLQAAASTGAEENLLRGSAGMPPPSLPPYQQQHLMTSTTATGSHRRESTHREQEEDYISLQHQQHTKRTKPTSTSWPPPSQPTILTGDEALRMVQEEGQSSPVDGDGQEQQHDDDAFMEPTGHFASDWEAQVTRRAGLTNSAKTTSRSATTGGSSAAVGHGGGTAGQSDKNSHLSWMDLRHQFASTLQKLSTQAHDLDRLRERRLTETEAAEAECQDRQVRVQQAGQALEFYQEWRLALVAWVGALRELHEKIPALQQAYNDLERDIAALDAWKDWEDDAIYELWQAGRLDQVLGRQPDAALFTTTSTTHDEFGRNVKSQQVMAREKRQRHRQHIQQQRAMAMNGNAVADEHAHTSDEELEVLRERHMALQKALAVALEQVDVEYTRLQNLVDLFARWQQAYPQEYQACYASLTLADLASVLVSVEMIGSLNDPWNESCGYNEAKWTAVVHDASTPKSSSVLSTVVDASSTATRGGVVFDNAGIERLVEKAVLPAICSLLSQSGYNLVSERQTRSLTNFLWYVQKILVTSRLDSPMAPNNDDNSTTATANSAIASTTTTRVSVAPVFNNDDGFSNQSRHHYGRGSQASIIVGNGRSSNDKSPTMKSLQKCVVAYIQEFLDGIAIPLVGKKTQDTAQAAVLTDMQKKHLEDALRAARVGQLHRIRTIIIHLLKYWAPLLGGDDCFAETILDFCSTKVLLLLSSLNGLESEEATETLSSSSSSSLEFALWSPSDVFRQIWGLLEAQERWMDRPEWMVQTITLRAAAEAYGVTSTKY